MYSIAILGYFSIQYVKIVQALKECSSQQWRPFKLWNSPTILLMAMDESDSISTSFHFFLTQVEYFHGLPTPRVIQCPHYAFVDSDLWVHSCCDRELPCRFPLFWRSTPRSVAIDPHVPIGGIFHLFRYGLPHTCRGLSRSTSIFLAGRLDISSIFGICSSKTHLHRVFQINQHVSMIRAQISSCWIYLGSV